METATSTARDELTARFAALDDFGRTCVLRYLIGYAPEAVKEALDEVDGQGDDHA